VRLAVTENRKSVNALVLSSDPLIRYLNRGIKHQSKTVSQLEITARLQTDAPSTPIDVDAIDLALMSSENADGQYSTYN
jgi:hypothetical protein